MQNMVDKSEFDIKKTELDNDNNIKILKEIGKRDLEKVDWDIKTLALDM